MSSKNPKPKQSPKPKTPRKLNKKALVALLIIAVPSTVLLAPALYYGSFTLRIARIGFSETTAVGQNPSYSGQTVRVEAYTVYAYVFSIQTAGTFRTTDTFVSSSQGTASITIKLTITTPSARTVNPENITIAGGIGTRAHTIYLGPNEGVRDPGLYSATITIAARITPTNGQTETGTTTIPTTGLIFLIPT